MLSSVSVECPKSLLATAQRLPAVPTAVANAGAVIPLESARVATEAGLIIPVLVGDPEQIRKLAKQIKWDISEFRLEPACGEVEAADTAVSLARNDEVGCLMKGDLHTDQLLKAVINQATGLLTGTRLSHVFHMTVPGSDEAICISDAVINVSPSVEIMLDIARNAATLMHALGNPRPNIAVLSATEVVSQAMPSSVVAEQVTREAAQGAVPGACVYGPLAFDNAVSPAAAGLKGIDNPVAGNADLLLVPNIETGNALCKQMVYFMSAAAAGLVVGAKVPITLTSRADPVAARLASAALASIYLGA